jgi:hypothetical protein
MEPAKYRSVSLWNNNVEDLKAIAAELSDETGVNHSINDAVTIVVKLYKNSPKAHAYERKTDTNHPAVDSSRKLA